MAGRHIMLKERMARLERSCFVVAVWSVVGLLLGGAVGFALASPTIWAWVCALGGGAVGTVVGAYAGWRESTLALVLRLPAFVVALAVGFIIQS